MKLFDSAHLHRGGSVRFALPGDPAREGFAIRAGDGSVRAYLNLCPHRGQPVDLGDGRLFTGGGAIECQAHGALFHPESGGCLNGPCFGRGLSPIAVEERDGAIWLIEP